MEFVGLPKGSFTGEEVDRLKPIMSFAIDLLERNGISLPDIVYFFNSFELFTEKVLPEVKGYGFPEGIAKELVACALNNGTYGTIDCIESSIIEMNFNPFKGGEYSSLEFLGLIIHEALHLHLAKALGIDVNSLKFRFSNHGFTSDPRIIQFDEGYAEFMTNRLLSGVDIEEIRKIKIPIKNNIAPSYVKNVEGFDIEAFDNAFEVFVIGNRDLGVKLFSEKFGPDSDNDSVLNFAVDNLRKVL
ncbi:MAG: hypothetical protein PF542_02945 [Nanoarchaeota archaeon]|jgi:hypothetical protein|nr:hypothetical protein [Nanoarchaeota archaeon]